MRSWSSLPSSLMRRAFSAICSCLHPYATARSKAISVVGVANTTRFLHSVFNQGAVLFQRRTEE